MVEVGVVRLAVLLGVALEAQFGEEVMGQPVERRFLAAGGQLVEPGEFRADVEKAGFALNPISAEDVAARVRGILATPKDVIDKTVALVGQLVG